VLGENPFSYARKFHDFLPRQCPNCPGTILIEQLLTSPSPRDTTANTPAGGLIGVMGGINLQGNPQFQMGANGNLPNGICVTTPRITMTAPTKKFDYLAYYQCFITFETPDYLTKRGLDPQDPSNWVIKGQSVRNRSTRNSERNVSICRRTNLS
jgi:hypothetical protein